MVRLSGSTSKRRHYNRHLPHIEVASLQHKHQRYDTAGDYEAHSVYCWEVRISKMSDWRYEAVVLIHELVEMFLLKHHNISFDVVDKWDLTHPESDDPGELPGCPYRKEHLAAEKVEKLFALLMGVAWDEYWDAFEKLKWHKKRVRRTRGEQG